MFLRSCARMLASMGTSDPLAGMPPVNWSDLGVSELPTGTVTLLLADVENSTGLWQTEPETMSAAVARLDADLSRIVNAHNGVRPVEQGEGDSFVVAFARATDAVCCALELQRAPLAPIRLRIGLHSGEIQLRDDSNYMGPTINRAARVRDLAHGGQTVLTATTQELVVDRLPQDTWLADLGSHPLRGIPRPERVVQLCHPDLRVEFPPLRSTTPVAAPTIPVQLTRFIGRAAEIEELKAALAENRLVTLTGAGGVGKTRLATELTAQLADDAGISIYYVDLAPITDPTLVDAAVARAVGLPDQPDVTAADSLSRRIGDRAVLIVLDNCEHLLEATAALVAPLLGSCPKLRLLATSREPLRSEAEVTWQVPSLSLADEAVELFTDRARHVRPDFSVSQDNLEAVTDICRRLDGMPLAIELAAARIRALSPTEILDSLHDRFRLLTGGARTAVRRQQTLRASVDWSHSLLTAAEAVLFRRLAVFTGGFDLDAAVAVCGGGGDVERYQVLDQLTLLVDKSLVQADNTSEHTRYRMLETIRHYALEKLGESGEADTIRTAHRDYYAELAAQLNIPGRANFRTLVEQAEADMDNLRAAFTWSQDRGELTRALQLASALQPIWKGRGQLCEGLAWYDAILDDDDISPAAIGQPVWTRAMADKAVLDSIISVDSADRADVAVETARHLSDPALLGRALMARGFCAGYDMETAAPYFAEAIEIVRETGDRWCLGEILGREAYIAAMMGDPAAATVAEQGYEVAASVGDGFSSHMCLWAIGMGQMFRADLAGAVETFRRVLAASEEDGDLTGRVLGLVGMGSTLVNLGEFDEARRIGQRAVELAGLLDASVEGAATAIVALADIAAGRGEPAYEAVSAAWRHPGMRRGTVAITVVAASALVAGEFAAAKQYADEAVATLAGSHKMWALTLRAHIALDRGDDDSATGDLREALCIAVANGSRMWVPEILETLAYVYALSAKHAEAARFLGAADAIRGRTGEVRWQMRESPYQMTIMSTREALGDSEFEAAWAQGAALSTDEAIAYALRGRGERRRPASGWASLTPAELDVARLVSDGLANKDIAERLFVSPRTVQAHLTHVYRKLGVSSRVQLAQEASRHVQSH